MPQRNRISLKTLLVPLGLVAMLFAIARRRPDDWEYESAEEPSPAAPPATPAAATTARPARRIALAATFTVLFFAGAAFTAGAGDQMAKLAEEDAAALEAAQLEGAPDPAETTVETAALEASAPASEAAPAEPTPAEAPPVETPPAAPAPADTAPADAAAAEATPFEAEGADAAPAEADAAAPATAETAATPAPSTAKAPSSARTAKPARAPKSRGTRNWVVARAEEKPAQAPEVEHEGHGQATVWLNRALPDPTPASARLTRRFATQLVAASKRHGAEWASVLAILRAQGERGSAPATAAQLDTLARRLSGTTAWKGALALSGRTGFADRTEALADLYRFVGLETLVAGYEGAKTRLARKVLAADGILIYAGGRDDIRRGRIDVRILTLVGYLAQRHGGVTVSSLFSGHRMFSRPGVISAHMYGHAVDVAAIGGTPILGNQRPGGLTEEAVRSVLLLPSELQPRQVISLLGLGGPSFPMRDHGDHIHVGY